MLDINWRSEVIISLEKYASNIFFLPTHSSLKACAVEFSGGSVGCFLYPGGHSAMQLCPSPAKMCPCMQEHR